MTDTDALPGFLEYWYKALHSPLGWGIRTSDPQRVRSILNSTRREAADPQLSHLTIRTSPMNPEGELWIVHGAKDS